MVLGKLPVPGRPTIWMIVGQGPIALAVDAGGGCLDIFTLLYPFFSFSLSLWETARSRCGWGWFGHFYSHLSFLFFLPLFGRRPDID